MSKAQREKESSHHEASVETTNKTITTASKTITTTSTTITTTSTTKKRQKRIESDSEDEEKILVSETSKKKFSVPDENFGLKKKTISTTTKKRENQIEIGAYTLLDNDHDDSSENEDLAVEFMSSRKVAKKDSSEKSMKEIERRGEIGMSSIPKDESLSRLSLKKTSSVDYDFSKDESPREIEKRIVDDDFPKNESPRQHDKRKSRDFMKDKIEDKKHQTNRPRDVKRSEDDGEEIVIIDDSESEMTQEEPSLQQHSFEYVKRDSLQSKFSSLPEVNSPTNASLEEFWKDVGF